MNPLAVRWLKFNFVGALGIVIQLACLALLVSGLHLAYLPATAIAVETAVLHNFVWHERFTWKDRTSRVVRSRARDIANRLLRFHAGNGAVSILGNLALMRLLVGTLHMKYLPANAITIAICSLANFAASEWFVFER
ncbi:MAG TPA: GtrA family protein [Bryobacteraceae bacterium]